MRHREKKKKSYYMGLILVLAVLGVSLTIPVAVATLSAPTGPDPSDGGVVSDTTPYLDWDYVSGADYYEVQLDDGSYVSSYPILALTSRPFVEWGADLFELAGSERSIVDS